MKKVVIGVVLFLAVLFVAALFVPHYYDPPPERMASTEMLLCSAALKIEIGNALLANTPIPEKLTSECSWLKSEAKVLPNGEIKFFNKEFGIKLELSPQINGSEISWSCIGSPNKYVPSFCRKNT